MTSVPEASGILADAEKGLRDLMQQKLRAQRYSEVAELAGMADALARLARGNPNSIPTSVHDATSPSEAAPARRASSSPPKRRVGAKRRTAKNGYPRFERDDDRLVKVGWSKKAREEYEHRAPRAAVLAFIEHLGSTAAKGKTFVIDELLPVHDAAGEELPSYQVYLTLAWLREVGAVEKKGRDGYVLLSGALDADRLSTLWDQLPARSA
jgi:hypothetical protein